MIQIILKFTFLSQIFPDQQHGNLVIHQLFSTQYLFQLNNSVTQQLSNSATQQLSNSATQQLSNSATQQLSNSVTQQLNNSATLLTLSTLHSCLSICCKAKAYAPSEMARLAPSFEMVIPMRFIGS
mgnify:CR=1 FL=1